MYEVAFTTGFREGLRDIAHEASLLNAIQRCVDALKTDPFQKMPNAKRLRGGKDRFRARLGDVRLLYRVETALHRIVLFAIGYRQDIYRRKGEGGKVFGQGDEPLTHLLEARGQRKVTPVDREVSPHEEAASAIGTIAAPETPIEVEVAAWITEEELWLLQIPRQHWEGILSAADAEAVEVSVPHEIRVRVESYVTSPAGTHVGRVYTLGEDGVDSVMSRPLHEFLTALDPEQQRVIQSGLNNGPYLVRGGPGTGKSLIGLHAIEAVVKNRQSESLFAATGRPRFGVITYTNTLSGFNESLIRHIRERADDEAVIECSTLDKIVYRLAEVALGRKPEPRSRDQVQGWMRHDVISMLGAAELHLVERLGLAYVVEEIEKVSRACRT